jgi:hypothetical protein
MSSFLGKECNTFFYQTNLQNLLQIAEVEGGILFVDKAYQLIPSQKEDENGYEIEASEEIMYVMNNGKVVVILIFLFNSWTCLGLW